MSESGKGRRAIGNALIVAGAVVILALGGYYGWTRFQGEKLRANLRSTPAPVAAAATTVVPVVTPAPTAPPPAALPSLTPLPPTATATELVQPPTATPTEFTTAAVATPTVTAVPTATPLPAATPAAIPAVSAGAPVRIVIPDLEIAVPVVEMGWRVVETANGPQSEWVIPENAAGHHINSAPLSVPGNIVISGHNNIAGSVFMPISQAWDDDNRARVDDYTDSSDILNGRTIQLYDATGRGYDYTITAFYRLRDTGVSLAQRVENARFMQPTADPQLTLITCWPPELNLYRLIVVARPAGGS